MIADETAKVNLLIYGVNRSVKKVYKIIYKSVDTVHELVYLIGGSRQQTQVEDRQQQEHK